MTKDDEIALLRQALGKASMCVNYMASGWTHSQQMTNEAIRTKVMVDSALGETPSGQQKWADAGYPPARLDLGQGINHFAGLTLNDSK